VGAAEGIGQESLVTRILLTGANGQLGADIVLAGADHDLHPFGRSELDVTNTSQVIDAVGQVMPDVIIHAGAYTAVDLCEDDPALAYAVNDVGTANVVAAATRFASRLIYVSTDYVFDGTKTGPYVETDTPNPASVYGASKLAGERSVAELGEGGLTVRTSWVCGVHGTNMVKTILRAAERFPELTFVDDQIGKPTFTADLADVLLQLAERSDAGVMHVTNEGVVSWYEFCREVLQAAGLDPDRVKPCSTHELQPPRPAPRPANSVLANTRFEELGISLLRDFREPLAEVVRDLTS